MTKVKVATVGEVGEGELKKVMVNKDPVALYKIGGEILATTNICTHEFCELDQNYMIHGEIVECTCHGSQFNVRTGENTLPPAAEPLKTYKVSVESDEIFVES